MGIRFGLRSQIVLVVALFVASLIVLFSSSLAAVWLPGREDEARQQLSAASRRMAEEAAALVADKPGKLGKKPPGEWHPRLEEITRRALADLEGVEGGFYLAGNWNQFTGYAFPNDPVAPPEPPPSEKTPPPPAKGKLKAKDKGKNKEAPPSRRDPPPKEKDFILTQCKASLTNEPDAPPVVQTTQIGLSRILVVTEPVGSESPALLATWVMIRLTRPEQLAVEARRNQASAGLALAGILVALMLTANLGRNLRRERRQRDQLREELRRSEHLASLGKLLAGVAHEVRNPLAAIRSTAQLYQRLPEQSRDPSALDAIVQGVDRLNALVSRLLFFVRSGYEQRRPIDLNAIVQETLTLMNAQAAVQGVVLQTELAELPHILGSSQALQQVVQNLTMNALQAMSNGGVLHCRTRRLDGPPRVELDIADTGPGIAPADQAHLFEPFWTTRPEGTGLGLALCREIVQQHGGQIDLVHQPGWGAVFRVSLPTAERGA